MQAHRGWLESVVYARLRDQHAVEEVLQETALAASKQQQLASDYEGNCRWLYRVAIRQALLYRRRQVRHGKKTNSSITGQESVVAIHDQNNPYKILEASEREDLVRTALEKLVDRDCEVLMLKYRDGWSCRDMAQRLGVSESATKSRLLRARNNLRRELLNLSENWELT